MRVIPYSTQDISTSDIRAVTKVLRSPYLTQGPAIERFEKMLAHVSRTRYAVVFNSGTAALHAAYFAAGVGPNDEVIIPAITFAATSNAALYLGAKPVFADVDPMTASVLVDSIRSKVTSRTKVIVAVDFGGRPADLHAIRSIAKECNAAFIEDGAQSLGASYQGKPVGGIADMTMFSFHPVKSITSAEGGVIVTNNVAYANSLRLFRSHGISKNRQEFKRKENGAWYQEMQVLGFNYRLTDVQAALGASQLKRLAMQIKRRRVAAERYRPLLQDLPIVLPVPDSRTSTSAWHLFPILLKEPFTGAREQIFADLRAAGIGVQVHYLPVYRHLYYEQLGYSQGLCPHAESFSNGEISLPLFPQITVNEQKKVAHALAKALKKVSWR